MLINSIPSGNGGGSQKSITMNYTGSVLPYDYVNTLQLLSSGVFTTEKDIIADIFLVGAGGGSGFAYTSETSSGYDRDGYGGGGGGGYTATHLSVQLKAGVEYSVVIGAGVDGGDGGSTSFGELSVLGGKKGVTATAYTSTGAGGAGGSGGGGGGRLYENSSGKTRTPGGAGGINGGNGVATAYGAGGTGQGTTTRAFGEADGKLFSTGGVGGTYQTVPTMRAENSGDGAIGSPYKNATSVVATDVSYAGGSGIVLIRFPDYTVGFSVYGA